MRATALIASIAAQIALVLYPAAAILAGPSAEVAGASAGWLSAVQRQIADAQYDATRQSDAGWQAPNMAHGFRTHFSMSGIRVAPRAPADSTWEWTLTLAAWGRPGAMTAVEPIEPQGAGQRIEYARPGILEWYVNDCRGLEQGFTVAARPATGPEQAADLVHIELALAGTLSPAISADGQAIDFATPGGIRVLHYAALTVRDALGQPLPARMEGFNRDKKNGDSRLSGTAETCKLVSAVPMGELSLSSRREQRRCCPRAVTLTNWRRFSVSPSSASSGSAVTWAELW